MSIKYDLNPATEQETAVLEQQEDLLKIVLFNDEVNSFDWVISSWIEYLTTNQAVEGSTPSKVTKH